MCALNSIDSLSIIALLQQSAAPTPVPIEIVDKVRQFYTDAWNMLLYYVVALIALVGVVVPLALQWYQQRTFKHEEAKLVDELSRKNETLVGELIKQKTKEMNTRLDESLKALAADFERRTARAEGGAYMVQSTLLWSQGRHIEALQSGLSAIKSTVRGSVKCFV